MKDFASDMGYPNEDHLARNLHASVRRLGEKALGLRFDVMLRTVVLAVGSAVLAVCAAPTASATASEGGAAARSAHLWVQAATQQLMLENFVSGAALQGIPWELAREDLQTALAKDPGLAPKYNAAISALGSIADLPDTDVTPAIGAEYSRYDRVVDQAMGPIPDPRFSYAIPIPGRSYRQAALAWSHEPLTPSRGVKVSYLREAASDLQLGVSEREAESVFYPALIQDLRDLEHAPLAAVASDRPSRYGAEINLLNYLFRLNQFSPQVLTQS
jgi:hypothetical protein